MADTAAAHVSPWGLQRFHPYPPATAEAGYSSIRLDPATQVTAYLNPAGLPVDAPSPRPRQRPGPCDQRIRTASPTLTPYSTPKVIDLSLARPVLVMSAVGDSTADLVSAELYARAVPAARVDPSDFGRGLSFTSSSRAVIPGVGDPVTGRLATTSRTVDLGQVRSIYWRRPEWPRFPDLPGPDATWASAQMRHRFGGSLMALPACVAVYRVRDEARAEALKPKQYASSRAARPYDLRHACVSTWLASGVEATQVAKWAEHSVAVLMSVYAKCLDDREDTAKHRIEAMLAEDNK